MYEDLKIVGYTNEKFGDVLCINCRGNNNGTNMCTEIQSDMDYQFIYDTMDF